MQVNEIKKSQVPIKFKPRVIEIIIESQDELDQWQGLLNYTQITSSIPVLNELSEILGFESNKYWHKLFKRLKVGSNNPIR